MKAMHIFGLSRSAMGKNLGNQSAPGLWLRNPNPFGVSMSFAGWCEKQAGLASLTLRRCACATTNFAIRHGGRRYSFWIPHCLRGQVATCDLMFHAEFVPWLGLNQVGYSAGCFLSLRAADHHRNGRPWTPSNTQRPDHYPRIFPDHSVLWPLLSFRTRQHQFRTSRSELQLLPSPRRCKPMASCAALSQFQRCYSHRQIGTRCCRF